MKKSQTIRFPTRPIASPVSGSIARAIPTTSRRVDEFRRAKTMNLLTGLLTGLLAAFACRAQAASGVVTIPAVGSALGGVASAGAAVAPASLSLAAPLMRAGIPNFDRWELLDTGDWIGAPDAMRFRVPDRPVMYHVRYEPSANFGSGQLAVAREGISRWKPLTRDALVSLRRNLRRAQAQWAPEHQSFGEPVLIRAMRERVAGQLRIVDIPREAVLAKISESHHIGLDDLTVRFPDGTSGAAANALLGRHILAGQVAWKVEGLVPGYSGFAAILTMRRPTFPGQAASHREAAARAVYALARDPLVSRIDAGARLTAELDAILRREPR